MAQSIKLLLQKVKLKLTHFELVFIKLVQTSTNFDKPWQTWKFSQNGGDAKKVLEKKCLFVLFCSLIIIIIILFDTKQNSNLLKIVRCLQKK